ncbi:tetratricopeptide repeat protein [Carboxylicivirga sp. M1479]|uniref:tetratricopeptide repeat protein n=1 Tax=Carboxylicivirga sp. M1479 TaxID=2594476 RepID=UPI00163DA156|nr:tetratricopeptide repeat protein [Carboxylicivirga sp. M1479]
MIRTKNSLPIFIPYLILLILTSLFHSTTAYGQPKVFPKTELKVSNKLTDTIQISKTIELSKDIAGDNFEEAINLANLSLQSSLQLKSKAFIARSQFNLAYLLLEYGENFDLPSAYFYKCLPYFEKTRDKEKLSQINYYLGYIFYRIGDNEQAISNYKNSQKLAEQTNDSSMIAKLSNAFGNYYHSRLKDYEKALNHYKKAQRINLELNDSIGIAHQCNNLGNIYLYQKNYEKAYKQYQLGIDICKSKNYPKTLSLLLSSMANYYQWLNDETNAELNYLEAIKVSQDKQLKYSLLYPSKRLTKLYEQQQRYREAYQYHTLHNETSEYLESIRHARKIHTLKWQFEQAKYENEINYKKRIVSVGFIALTLLFLLITSYTLNKLKQRRLIESKLKLEHKLMNNRLEFNTKKLLTQTIHMTRYAELSNTIITELTKVKYNIKKQDQEQIDTIISNLRINQNETIWDEFKTHFEHVNVNFYKNLHNRHPNLTSNDAKLCAFLKLNMSSKEIAAIMHKSVDSIESARKRLRKKLNLQKEEQLNVFLAKY